MQEFTQQTFTEERALFHTIDARISDSVFDVGESPLKECRKLDIDTTLFRYKYPLWYCKDVSLKNCTLFDMARAGIWYTDNVSIEDTVIEAPKNIRKADGVTLKNVSFPNAAETLWNCNNVTMENVFAKGDYFAFNTNNIKADNFTLVGNYSFDGTKNMEIRNSKLLSKDALSWLECEEPHAYQLHNREPSGHVLYRQSCDEELQAHQHNTCIRIFKRGR